ncbi:MAG: hypothetical protein GWP10_14885, partial [Nitrospiraceae bacterium]|nr:hypothetical protein [Nitrospiraceae bacterium]
REVKAKDLKEVGIYNVLVTIETPFPKKERTEDPQKDKERYAQALQDHNDAIGEKLLSATLGLAVCPVHQVPVITGRDRKVLATVREIEAEVNRRKDPGTYDGLWGKPLKEVRDEIKKLGKPLAPQSIGELERLFTTYRETNFDEGRFVEEEMQADSRLYRDPRFRRGIIATLEQKVADFREEQE